ncbi:MAG: DUF1150 family protein [Alphaproteobacteria bacterium]|nr:DUF1150 family protein [Alphaproteobacteria bacterium]MCZ6763929.1 DUF1150 family protein [Alphaproteobacteria bacterium]
METKTETEMVATNEYALRHITSHDLAVLGLNHFAYVTPKRVGGNDVYAIHTADGNEVAVVDDHDLAVATILQNDLEPVQVH